MQAEAAIRINERAISEDEINREMQYHPADSPEEARRQAAVALSVRELLLAEAERLGIDGRAHADAGVTDEEARIRELLEREVERPEPTEDECRRFFDSHRERFRTPPTYDVSHILRPAATDDAGGRSAARARCRRILRVARADPERFARLARRHSRCPSAADGGHLGIVGPGQTCTEFERALDRAPVGEPGRHPLETRYGFHAVFLHARDPGEPLTFEQAHGRITSYLRESVWRRGVSQYVRILAGRNEVRGVDLGATDNPLVQ